jgi:autotransporter-associated beta strand protein
LGAAETAAGLTFNNVSTAYTLGGSSALTLSGPNITDNTSTSITTVITAVVAGSAGLNINFNASATLALEGADTYSGGTTINTGAVNFYNDSAFGVVPGTAGTNITLTNGASINYATSGGTTTLNANRGIAVGNGSGGYINAFSSRTLNYGGVITNVSGQTGNFTTASLGTLILSGNSTYGGYTNISAGAIKAGTNNPLPTTTILGFNAGAYPTYTTPDTGAPTFDLNGYNQSIAGLADTSTSPRFIYNGAVGTSTLTVTGGGTFNGTIEGGGGTKILALTKTGTGTLTLGGTDTYTGVTNITGGTLALGSNGSLTGTPTINVGSGATFDVSANGGFSLSSAQTLMGVGNVNGTLTLNSGTITAGTPGSPGTLAFNNSLSLGGGTLAFPLSGTSNTSGGGINGLITVAGSLNLNSPTPVTATFSGTPAVGTGYAIITAGSVTGSASNFAPVTRGYTVAANATNPDEIDVVVTGTTAAANLTWTGAISSTWDMYGWSTGPGTFNFVDAGTTTADQFYPGDNVTFDDTPGVPTSVNIGITLLPGSVTVNSSSNNFSFSGGGKISGTTGLTKMGASTLTITTTNDYSGPTVIDGGILNTVSLANVNTASGIGKGSVTGSSSDLVLNGGTLQYTGSTSQSSNRLLSLGTAGGTIDNSGSAALLFTGTGAVGFNGQAGPRTLTLTGTTSVTPPPGNLFAPVIGDNGGSTSLVKTGNSTWELNGLNTFTGTINISGGTLAINSSDSNLGAVPSAATPGLITISNGGALADNATGTIVLNSNRGIALGTGGGYINTYYSKTLSYGGIIANAPSASGTSLSFASLGTEILSGNSTYTGPTSLQAGTLKLGITNALPVTTTLAFNAASFAATFDLAGYSQTVAGLTDTTSLAHGITSSAAGTATLTVAGGGNFGSLGTTGGAITNGATGDVVALTEAGPGTLSLGGLNTYTGPTNISGGTLSLAQTGSINNSSAVNVLSGGTFNLAASNGASATILNRTVFNLNVASGGVVTASPAVSPANRQLLVVGTLTIGTNASGAYGGLVDLSSNDMVVSNAGASGLATITSEIAQGYNLTGGGNWQGSGGITSSAAAADTSHLSALGVMLNNGTYSSSSPFDGYSAGSSDVLVKFTTVGDANLDGVVDGSDYSLIDAGYASQQPGFTGTVLTGWANGDFNYDGVIDGSDYALIDNAYNDQQLSAAESSVEAAAAVIPPAAVPEPAASGIAAAALAAAARIRRRARR